MQKEEICHYFNQNSTGNPDGTNLKHEGYGYYKCIYIDKNIQRVY